ncbi:MAG TPA: M48 family metallopeptidase [Pseudomonadales bacterium]|nr:M48 family metallopeptidase [Pseudomonadales bacterium]
MNALRYIRSGLALCLLLLLTACATTSTTKEGATGIDRKQFMMLSSDEVNNASAQQYKATLAEDRKKGTLNRDPAAVERVNRVSRNLIKQVGVFRSDAPGWKWEINVESNKELNAYCAPGGKIMVFTGLLDKLQLSDDELAAVIGHEMAHALREHGREQMSEVYAQQMGLGLIGILAGMDSRDQALMQIAGTTLITLPHSRQHEKEADIIGLELAARAGYNPNAAITLWQKMQREGGGSGPSFLSTHPSGKDRIAELQKKIPRVMPLYEAAKNKS